MKSIKNNEVKKKGLISGKKYGIHLPSLSRNLNAWGCGAVGSASEWHSEGRGFESHQLHFFFESKRLTFYFHIYIIQERRQNNGY